MSVFLTDYKALFIHIPRTGGGWMQRNFNSQTELVTEKWYEPGSNFRERKHTIPEHFHPVRRWARVRFMFTFVRHPIQYYESQWRWMYQRRHHRRKELNDRTHGRPWMPMRVPVMEYCEPFEKWAWQMLERHPGWVTRLFELYVGPEVGENCHFIGRTETLADDFVQILGLFGHEADQNQIDRRRANTAPYEPGIIWGKDLRAAVENDERVTIRRFYGDDTADLRIYCMRDNLWKRKVRKNENKLRREDRD